MSINLNEWDRKTPFLLPTSIEDWLAEGHLARFMVEIVEQLDRSSLKESWADCGSQPHNPAMLVELLLYRYAVGVFFRRKLERSTYHSVAFSYVAVNSHPDHDPTANFHKRLLKELIGLFVQILLVARQMGILKLGNVSLDDSKVKANAPTTRGLAMILP